MILILSTNKMFFRIFKYSVKNSLRNKFLSISSVLVLTLLMFFVNILFTLDDVSNSIINNINSKLTISLYVNENYTNTSLEITDFLEEIKKLQWWINVDYKTKDDILSEMRSREPDLVKILEKSNPLPDTIVLSNISLSDYDKVNNLVKTRLYLLSNDESQEDYFANYTTQYKKIEDITSILKILQSWLSVIIVIFIVSIAIIIYSVIGNFIYYYRDEIYITKLVWWSNIFIYWPFVLQWIMYSFLAFFLNLIILIVLLKNMNIMYWYLYSFSFDFSLAFLEFILFVIIWWTSWFYSSKRYLK